MNDLSDPIPFAYPFIAKEEEDAVLGVLRSGWLTTGAQALGFEKDFQAFLGPDVHALAVNSATSGLHLALEACGVGPGDVVLTCPYTFTATAEVARYLGADVAFVDTQPGSYLIDPIALKRTLERLSRGLPAYPNRPGELVGPVGSGELSEPGRPSRPRDLSQLDRPRAGPGEPRPTVSRSSPGFGPRGRPAAVIPVHFAGLLCDMDAIAEACAPYGTRVVEDAAHSFPSRLKDGRWGGLLGDAGVYSFYATKTITTGEGGMVVTRNADIAARVAVMRSHGIDRSVWNRYTDSKASWRYAVVEAGFKYNLPDILAALGRVQLTRALDLLAMRQEIAAEYDRAFDSDIRFMIPPTGDGDARHLYPLRLVGVAGTAYRDRFIRAMQEGGVGVSVHFIPLHTMPYYAERYGLEDGDFPNTLEQFERTVSLPIWPGMTKKQVARVIELAKSSADTVRL